MLPMPVWASAFAQSGMGNLFKSQQSAKTARATQHTLDGEMASGSWLWMDYSAYENVTQAQHFTAGAYSTKDKEHYELVVAGGGSGGTAVSSKFARMLGPGKVALIEPKEEHWNQPSWSLVGGGLKDFRKTVRRQKEVTHKNCHLIQDKVVLFHPEQSKITISQGTEIDYDFLVIALGVVQNPEFDEVRGLPEALQRKNRFVTSIYHPIYVQRTFSMIQSFRGGQALFTMPPPPVKCSGASLKIMLLAEERFRMNGVRDQTKIFHMAAGTVLVPSPIYEQVLERKMQERGIISKKRTNLIQIDPLSREARFGILDGTGTVLSQETMQYDFLHVTPPCRPVKEIQEHKSLTNASGFVTVDKHTLQHTRYANIFALGDCTDLPTGKSAAAVACQSGVLGKNLASAMQCKPLEEKYSGYTSCPVVTSKNTVILAEVDYTMETRETFHPFLNQKRESRIMFSAKKHIFPPLYWKGLLRGYWEGPEKLRRIVLQISALIPRLKKE